MLGAVSAPLVAAICLYCLLAYLRCLPASILPACISPFICRRRGEEKKEQVGRPCLVSMLPQPEPEEVVSGTCPKDFNLLLDTPPLSPFLKADPRHAAMRWLNEAESPAEDEPEDEPEPGTPSVAMTASESSRNLKTSFSFSRRGFGSWPSSSQSSGTGSEPSAAGLAALVRARSFKTGVASAPDEVENYEGHHLHLNRLLGPTSLSSPSLQAASPRARALRARFDAEADVNSIADVHLDAKADADDAAVLVAFGQLVDYWHETEATAVPDLREVVAHMKSFPEANQPMLENVGARVQLSPVRHGSRRMLAATAVEVFLPQTMEFGALEFRPSSNDHGEGQAPASPTPSALRAMEALVAVHSWKVRRAGTPAWKSKRAESALPDDSWIRRRRRIRRRAALDESAGSSAGAVESVEEVEAVVEVQEEIETAAVEDDSDVDERYLEI
jgi:hypothetical protein